MSKSLTHTRADRALDSLLRQNRVAKEMGLIYQLIEDSSFHGDTITINGREVVNFGLCSYLGLGDDPRLINAAVDAVRRYGNSYSSSIAYTAVPLYADLRERLSAMMGSPVLVAGSTTLAHMAALPVLVRSGDRVIVDSLAHASILSVLPMLQANGAEVRKVAHNDLVAVSDHVDSAPGRSWYLLDGVYSMKGDTAPAEDLMSLLDAHPDLWAYCDDAHGIGWRGETGQGQFLERAGWHDRLIISFGLAKSFGTMGGVIAAQDGELIERIEMTGGPMIFGGPLPPPVLGAGVASADIHLSDELTGLQIELSDRITFVNDFAATIGLPLASSEETPLWFVEIGPAMTTASATAALARDGFFLNGAVFPAVPRRRGGLRFTVTRYLGLDQIEAMLTRLNEVRVEYSSEEDVIDLTVLENEGEPSEQVTPGD